MHNECVHVVDIEGILITYFQEQRILEILIYV